MADPTNFWKVTVDGKSYKIGSDTEPTEEEALHYVEQYEAQSARLRAPTLNDYQGGLENVPSSSEELAQRNFQAQESLRQQGILGPGQRAPGILDELTALASWTPQEVQDAPSTLAGLRAGLRAQARGEDPDQAFAAVAGGRSEPPGTAAQVTAGLQNVGMGTAIGFLDPTLAAPMVAGALVPPLAPLVAAGFAADMLSKYPEAARQAGEASAVGTPYEKTVAYGNLGLSSTFIPALGKAGAHPLTRTADVVAFETGLRGFTGLTGPKSERVLGEIPPMPIELERAKIKRRPPEPIDPIKQTMARAAAEQRAREHSPNRTYLLDRPDLELGVDGVMDKFGWTRLEAVREMKAAREKYGTPRTLTGKSGTKIDADDLYMAQLVRDEGQLSQEGIETLDALERELGVWGLETLDAQALLDGVRELGGRKVRGRDVVTTTEPELEGDAPFRVAQTGGRMMRAIPESNTIQIYPDDIATFRAQERKAGRTDAEIDDLIRGFYGEEVFHLATPEEVAISAHDAMTDFERDNIVRRYFFDRGGYSGQTLSPAQIGYEGIRFMLEKAHGKTPMELRQMTSSESRPYRIMELFARAARGWREILRPEERVDLDSILQNIDIARDAAEAPPIEPVEPPGGRPGAAQRPDSAPDYSRPPKTRGEAIDKINDGFAYVRSLDREGKSKLEIEAEVRRLDKYGRIVIGVNDLWMKGEHEFQGAPKPTQELIRDMEGFNASIQTRLDQLWKWFDETSGQQSFPGAAIRNYDDWKNQGGRFKNYEEWRARYHPMFREYQAGMNRHQDWLDQYIDVPEAKLSKEALVERDALEKELNSLEEDLVGMHEDYPEFSKRYDYERPPLPPLHPGAAQRPAADETMFVGLGLRPRTGARVRTPVREAPRVELPGASARTPESYDQFRDLRDGLEEAMMLKTAELMKAHGPREERWPSEAKAQWDQLAMRMTRLQVDHPEWNAQYQQQQYPGASNRPLGKKEQERAALRNKLRQMRVEAGLLPPESEKEAASVGRREPATESPMSLVTYAELTPETAGKFIGEYFDRAAESIVKDREKRRHLDPKARGRPLDPPSYEDLASQFRMRFGPVPSSQLRDAVFEHIAGGLNQATGAHIKEIVRAMRLTEAVVGRGKPGERMLSEMPDTTPGFEQLKLGIGDVKNKAELYKALARAAKRAQRAKNKEARYLSMLEQSRALHKSLRDFERPEGKSSGPIWDVDEKGGLVSRTGEKITEDLPPRIRKNAIELAELRKAMDELLYPEKQRKPEERIVIEEEPGEVGETIRTKHYQKGEEEYAPPAFEPRASVTPAMRTGQGTRVRAIGAILHEIYKQSEQSRKPINRKEVTPDELASPLDAEEPVFRSIRGNELKDVDELGRILTSDARVGPKVSANITKRLVVLQSNTRDNVVMVDVYRHPNKTVMVRSTGQTDIHQSLSSILKSHTPVYSILLDEPVKNFRKAYANIREFMDEFGNDAQARMRAMEMSDYPTEGARISPGTTGDVSQPGELTRGEGVMEGDFVPSPVTQAGKPASGAMGKTLLGRPAAIEVRRPLTDAEAHGVYDYITGFGEMRSLGEVGEALESLKGLMDDAVAKKSTAKLPWQAISGLAKMMRQKLAENPDVSDGAAMFDVSKFLYENWQRTENRQQLVERTVANFRGELPEAGPGAGEIERAAGFREAESRLEQQALDKARAARIKEPLERERTVAPGTLPVSGEARAAEALDVRALRLSAEAMEEAAARKVREPLPPTGPVKYDPEVNRQIQQEYVKEQVDDSYFDKAIKVSTEAATELTAQLAKELPQARGETAQQYVQRVREWAEKQAEMKEAQAQGDFGESVTPGAAARWLLPIGKGASYLTSQTVGKGIRIGSEWMVDRLRRVAPAHALATHRELRHANEIISRSQQYAGDMFQRFGDEILEKAGKNTRVNRWLNEFQVIRKGEGAVINAKEAIEGRLIPPNWAARDVADYAEGNILIGQFLEPTAPGFIANGGMHNMHSAFGYDVLRDGPNGPFWGKWVRSQADANHVSYGEMNNFFLRYKRMLDDPNTDASVFFRFSQEFARYYPVAVTHLWSGVGKAGHWEPVIHSDLFNYFNHGIRRAAMIRAFREFYPAEGRLARATRFEGIMRSIRSELPSEWHGLVNTLYRTLQGHPSENISNTGWMGRFSFQVSPSITQPAGVAARMLEPVGSTLKTAVLSQQILLQPAELLTGGSSIFFGYRKSLMSTMRHKSMFAMLEGIGALDKMMYNNAWMRNSPIRSAFRIANNQVRKWTGQILWNELQEAQSAGAAYINAQRLQQARMIDTTTGRPMVELTWEERNLLPQTFRVMGFTPREVSAMMRGDPRLLGQMVREAAAFTSGGHVHPAQQSRMLANRAFQNLVWFQRYPATRANQFVRLWQVLAEESKAGNTVAARNTAILMAKFMAGATAQGALQGLIMLFFYGGPFAVAMRFAQAKDEPFAFFFDSWRSTMAGPFQFITRGWEDSGWHGVANNFKRISAPVNIAGEVWDATTGSGKYRDMEAFDRWGKFVSQRIPVAKMPQYWASTIGLTLDDKDLRTAMTGFSRWQRQKYGYASLETYWKEDDSKEFRVQMKKALEAMKSGDMEAMQQARVAAVGAKLAAKASFEEGVQAVNASLLKRRVLTDPKTSVKLTPIELQEVRDHIGEEALSKLQYFDKMLEIQAGKFD